MSNALVEIEDKPKHRTAFIDWQMPFYGNGFVDLTFLLYYGVHIEEFTKNPNLYEDAFSYYM